MTGRHKSSKSAGMGEGNVNSKLTESDVIEIRRSYRNKEMNQYQLAEKYKVSQPSIGCIIRRETWRHI
jgi:predicted XRE-type DNA-binding protein